MSELVPVITSSSIVDTTLAQYIEFCKQYLYTGSHEVRGKLSVGVDEDDTTLTIAIANTAFQPNIRVSCELEDMYVWTCNDGKTMVVERGQFGSLAASHAANVMVYASPKFSDAEILREINRAIQSLSAPGGLFAVGTLDITTTTARAYDFPIINAMDILDIRVRTPGDSLAWPLVYDWYFEQNAGSDFASGNALFINDALPVATTIHVTYSYPFSPIYALSDLVVSTTGLAPSQFDLPLYAAAIALTSGREIKRNWNETQGQTRRAEEVGPGANLASANALRAQYRARLVEEANKLRKAYPTRKKRVWNY